MKTQTPDSLAACRWVLSLLEECEAERAPITWAQVAEIKQRLSSAIGHAPEDMPENMPENTPQNVPATIPSNTGYTVGTYGPDGQTAILSPRGCVALMNAGNQSTREKDAELIVRAVNCHDDMLDALCDALPFVEDALKDKAFKPGFVRSRAAKIRRAIAKAEGKR